MSEPEVALAFTADFWVEELHRHLTDHGGARVRTLLVEPESALEESYDVLVAGHRWPTLTRALIADVRAGGRAVLGVHDREEPASRDHLIALGVDALIESDAGPDAFVRAIVEVSRRSTSNPRTRPMERPARAARLVTVGGPPGVGRTEIAIELAVALGRRERVVLVDVDDVAPAIAGRLDLPLEPNLRTAIDTVEHGRGDLDRCLLSEPVSQLPILTGLPSASSWGQVRPPEVLRVLGRLGDLAPIVVADGAGMLEDVGAAVPRSRFATARALVARSDLLLAVCDPSPNGVVRLLAWSVEALALAPGASLFVVVNRAPDARFRRGELYEEIAASLPAADVAFVPGDRKVGDAAWGGTPVARGAFTRAVAGIAGRVADALRRPRAEGSLEEAS